jgi:hypothetical protein
MIGFSGLGAPTVEQSRFAMQYIGRKPHLKAWRGQWRCIGLGWDCLGDTLAQAHANWKAMTGGSDVLR